MNPVLKNTIGFILISWTFDCNGFQPGVSTFRAAVYEHAVILPDVQHENVSRESALKYMMMNLNIYKTQVETAAGKGADIIVFPEDGIYGMGFTRNAIFPYLEYIPDPKNETWSPCTEPDRYPNAEVQHFLSCLAKNNSLYLVANFGDKQPCSKDAHEICPSDGHYQYNTDVVYDPEGHLVAKYHKENLFFEYQFDVPTKPEIVTFPTPFGIFGVFTCFDVLFHDPAIDLVNRGIRNIVFPTAWMRGLPLLSALPFHSAFARGMGLNFLAANINWPEHEFHGSGIYTPDGIQTSYYNDREQQGKLLIADVPIIDVKSPSWAQSDVSNLTTIDTVSSRVQHVQPSSPSTFHSLVFHDTFTFKRLDDISKGSVDVCQKSVCCHLKYDRNSTNSNDVYAFGAFDGLHNYNGKYYTQVCTLLRCAGSEDGSCGTPTKEAQSLFSMLEISGNFSSPYVFPEVVLSRNGSLTVPPKESWSYGAGVISSRAGFSEPLLSATLFGRVYTKFDTNGYSTRKASLHQN